MKNNRLNEQENAMSRYWDERSKSYSEMNRKQLYSDRKEAWERAIFSHVEEEYPLKVLDIGTGPGFFAIIAALRGHRVTGVDMNEEMLAKAKENADEAGIHVNFVHVGHSYPFSEGSFDLILSRDVTWALTEPEEQMREWAALLKPGGKLLYFDAEWNYHLKNRKNYESWLQVKQSIEEQGIVFYPKAGELEKIAVNLPMTHKDRPGWDASFWKKEGYSCTVYENLNEQVFIREEQIHYQMHPVFLVEVKKEHE